MRSSKQKPKFQVVTLGHPLSQASLAYLRKLGPYKIFKINFHIERFSEPYLPVYEIFKHLKAMGCDLSGRTETIWQIPGTSLGALVFVCGWHSLTGEFPRVLNLIRRGEKVFNPSPELPVADLNEFRKEFPQVFAEITAQDQDTAEAEAVDDGYEIGLMPEINGRELRSEFRQARNIEFGDQTRELTAESKATQAAIDQVRAQIRSKAGLPA